MTQTRQERIDAIESLLPLCESHLDIGRLVARAAWESTYEPPPPGYVPPPPEADCDGACPLCSDFATSRCTVREAKWAWEWMNLRCGYPELFGLEHLVGVGTREDPGLAALHPDWASAIYWHYVQPWDPFKRGWRKATAKLAVGWLADEWERREWGWLPTYVPKGMPRERNTSDAERDTLIIQLRIDGLSYNKIHNRTGASKTTIKAVLSGQDVRRGRILNAEGT